MTALVANPGDAAADALLSADPNLNRILRTTCVATMLNAGHAPNALPQRAGASINFRIFPGVTREAVRDTLVQAINDPAVTVSEVPAALGGAEPALPPLTARIMGPIETLSARMWPGVPVVRGVQAWATDGRRLTAAGIPTYGVTGLFVEPDLGHIHGLNERIGVRALMEGRAFMYRLVRIYAEQKAP